MSTTPAVSIGIDVGGTKMLGVAVDARDPRRVVGSDRIATPSGVEAVVDAVGQLVERLSTASDAPVGVGIPGLVDHRGHFLTGPNLPGVVDVPLGELLSDRLGRPVAIDNDATCATLAESTVGASRNMTDSILLTIGTGIGAGLVIDGAIRRGARGFAGEPGHMVIDPSGPRCPCGRRGCWERYASGSGLGRLGRDAAIAGRLDAAVELGGGDVEAVRGEHVVAAARAGDAEAGEVLDEFAWWLATGIANLVDVLDPQMIVLGGGVMEAADVLLHRVQRATPELVLAGHERPPVAVVAAELGEEAGAVGAALLPPSVHRSVTTG